MANSRTYTGSASGVNLGTTFTAATPASGDARTAASVQEAVEPLVDKAEALRLDGGNPAFGDGSDGAAAFDGTNAVTGASRSGSVYTLTRHVFYTTCTISNNVEVKSAGYILHANSLLDMNSTSPKITANGNAASGVTAGAAIGGILGGSAAGGNGGAGGGANNGSAGDSVTIALGGAGGAGGTGAGGAGAAGTATAPTATQGAARQPFTRFTGFALGTSGIATLKGGGGGGGGGGGTGAGGGGGGPGGVLIVNARRVKCSASAKFEAKGGAGANASGGNTAGGGGGGGGGAIIINYRNDEGGTAVTSCTDVTGGAAGTATSGGVAGSAGSAGNTYINRV